MIVERIDPSETETMSDPAAVRWSQLDHAIHVELSPTPLGLQPTAMIRNSWEDRPYGLIESATVAALHDGTDVLVRVTWKDPHKDDIVEDNDQFPDKMALMFPLTEDADMFSMGSGSDPVELWRWNADDTPVKRINATGIGETVDVEDIGIESQAVWQDGEWQVVMRRKMNAALDSAKTMTVGETSNCGLAIWAGHNKERAGLKSIAMRWIPLEIAG